MSFPNSNRTNWRQRMADKERREKEAAAHAAEQERLKHTVLNETNFPSHLVSTARPVTHVFKIDGFASRAADAERKEQAERTLQQYQKQRTQHMALSDRILASGIVAIHRKRHETTYREEDLEEEQPQMQQTLDELYPRHRGRHYSTEPDSDGWREVIPYYRKKRVLTNAELERKARAEILGEDDESEDTLDMNGDLSENGQRRHFY